MIELKIGEYIEKGVDWLSVEAAFIFDFITKIIEGLIVGLQTALVWVNPYVMILLIGLLSYYLKARQKSTFTFEGFKNAWGLTLTTILGLLLIMGMGFWVEAMETLALVITSAFIALLIGIPLGITAARNDSFNQVIRPVLDFMQTMPAFVYLIPAILFFSVGNVPGVVATVVFALPPGVRLTNLGIRNVPGDVIEASHAFGASPRQLLYKVQIPLAMTTIMAGVNQVIMLALSMVVIASMVGAEGLGQLVYKGILQAKVGLGFEAGMGIVVLAIILDRITQALDPGSKK